MQTNLFGDYVRRYCREHNLTLTALAEKSGIPRSTLHRLLQVDSHPKFDHIFTLARAMNIHSNLLMRLKYANAGTLADVVSHAHMPTGDASGFVDESPPDGVIVMAGSRFVKSWTLHNIGNTIWQNRKLICMDTAPHHHTLPTSHDPTDYQLIPRQPAIAVPTTPPYEQVTLSVVFDVPKFAGRYISYWKMVDEQGQFCFPDSVGVFTSVLVQ